MAEAADPVDPVDAPEAGLYVVAKSVPFAQNTLRISTTKISIKFGGSFLNGPRLSPAAVLASAPNTNAP